MKRHLTAILLLLNYLFLNAQEKGNNLEVIASVQPQFAFSNAFRLDVEINPVKRFPDLIISPEIYSGYLKDEGSYREQRDQISGAGIGISHKINFKGTKNRPYIAYGFMYRDLNIRYEEEGFVSINKEGLDYYEFGKFSDRLKISSFLISTCAGIQITNFNRFILDFYGGVGLKNSTKESTYPDKRDYAQEQHSLAFSGFLPLAGLKIGYKIR